MRRNTRPTLLRLLPFLLGALLVAASNDPKKEEEPDEDLTITLSPAVTAVLGILALVVCCFCLGRKSESSQSAGSSLADMALAGGQGAV